MIISSYPTTHKFEHIPTRIYADSSKASRDVAQQIADLIRHKQGKGQPAVLGLATGSTPVGVYNELVRMHREEGLSFRNVVSFNLDEYYPMQPEALQSYHRFMREYLFDLVDIDPANVHVPDGTLTLEEVEAYCASYESKIEQLGGLDIQILGIGRTGHIGFNEPGSALNSRTRLISLDHITVRDAASDFFHEANVPKRAITMGVGTILEAKSVILMAWGEGKAPIIQEAVEGPVSELIPATYLQKHPNATVILDEASSAELTRVKAPWLVGRCNWDDKLIRSAVIWLCQTVDKSILKLTDHDYSEHGMGDLITEFGSAYRVNIKVFNELQHTITGWPGGKPDTDDTYRPERRDPAKKRVIIFSPHPDDDVISMGGTLIRLVEQGHEVHVAYQVSGNIAVFDDAAVRFIDFALDFAKEFGQDADRVAELYQESRSFLDRKKPGDVDSDEIKYIKGLIRKGEAKSACRYCGIPDERAHFLDMPFYETGTVKKKPLGEEDVQIIMNLIEEIKPHQIYAAGDLSDPHGTHRVCLQAIFEAIERLKDQAWMDDCWVWLYRGAWQEWGIEDIEMAVPISPIELQRKREAIFKHQSQKDSALFPGNDPREFWQRAEDRNRNTAQIYDQLGLPEYEAIEAFVRYHFD
ncbi:glucosamine-6-phosphate deaminase [Pontibacter sp. G13]|uniref:glucosamine-6-phosphate deaminase n=1 Tax=Pontibacter sp. G13 TaxID=3074898 RepID=UPI00288A2E44|nr:glucosamine-6-phosphate deaminase [Pontibacter sp. G13]WNJ18127.1 glucosamine-6-phosphate deaminase [Pontibacter sp. G13]